jgi:CPA2 family monovalent cation:H+ antiporter-2
MKTLKQILTVSDLTLSSKHAIHRGFLLAQAANAKYNIVHALNLDPLIKMVNVIGNDTEKVKQSLIQDAQNKLLEITNEPQGNKGLPAETIVLEGQPTKVIPPYTNEISADLIIAGERGKGFMHQLITSSTAIGLMRKCKAPILVVKNVSRHAYQKVMIAVDFSPTSIKAVQVAKTIAPEANFVLINVFDIAFEGKLRYAGVNEDIIHQYRKNEQTRALKRMHDTAQKAGLNMNEYEAIVVHGEVTHQILLKEQEFDIDMIVMGKHGENMTEELLLGSVTKHTLSESQCDVLVVSDFS